jgi:hypothetical protein|tara:strand:+ start:1563 stop:1925 length:363 start_codon:yes stop_codon:yes gene_type:complete
MEKKADLVWLANYYYRNKILSTSILSKLQILNVEPEVKQSASEMKHYTLKEYIEFIGMKEAAEEFNCSSASVKAWRYGYRQPSIAQAKRIIKATEGKLDFESIYGNLSKLVADSVQSDLN